MNRTPEIVQPMRNPVLLEDMKSPLRALLHSLRGLFLGLAVLCVFAQPVLSAAHELHEAEHVLTEHAAGLAGGSEAEVAPAPGTLDGLLHAFDCCLHATAIPAPALTWIAHRLQSRLPGVSVPGHMPSHPSRFLRPPIAA